MVVTVTVNPCRDKTLVISRFTHGGMNRVLQSREDLCGKGINVSAALKGLGLETICLGLHYDEDAGMLEDSLQNQGIAYDFVRCPGKIRTNVKVFEQDTGVMTEINEKGQAVSRDRLEELLQKARGYARSADIFVISGSAPPDTPADFYRTLTASVREVNPSAFVILDAEGPLLLQGLKAGPNLIKPNRFELETAYGVRLDSREKLLRQCRDIIREGIPMVCVSLGEEGALLVRADGAYFAPALDIQVKSLQGAGDSLVAGMCKGILEDRPADDILRCAAAAAAGSIAREGTLLCRREDFERLYPLVRTEQADDPKF